MKPSFLQRRSVFGINNALAILLVFFFLVPFAVRGARMSLRKTENNVKDWLPDSFQETTELNWFGEYFAGERFVIATWPGATAEDQRLKMLVRKLEAEAEGSEQRRAFPDDWARARELAGELGLLVPGSFHRDWGGRDEKWLTNEDGQWFYVTPRGHLYRWDGGSNVPSVAARMFKRLVGGAPIEGQFIAAFASDSETGRNPYYNDPHLLAAPLFKTVETGPEMVEELAQEGGPLWPVGATAAELRPRIAERRALERLTGTMFAPAVPPDFDWTPEAFAEMLPEPRREELPEDWQARAAATMAAILERDFGGRLENLRASPSDVKADVWYQVFDALEVTPPARQTAVLVTLTPLAERNLENALGRGVAGLPRGRLLQLAEESGIAGPPRPSAAPPPFNRLGEPSEPDPRPQLRLGGPPVTNIAIDEEGSITLMRLLGYSTLVGLLLTYICFRSVRITLMVFFVGSVTAAASLGTVWWVGESVDAVLLSMPALVYVLALSGAIHIINYYRDEVSRTGLDGAPERALAHGWIPCLLAAVTTGIGLMSLYASNILPIRKFGLFSAIGVVMAVGIVFAYLPAALTLFGARRDRRDALEPPPEKGAPQTAAPMPHSRLADAWEAGGRWLSGHNLLVASLCLAVFIATAIGLPRLQTSVELLKLFDEDAQVITDYAWLETYFGRLVPMELVLRVPPEMQRESEAADPSAHPLTMLERVEAVAHVQNTVERAFGERGTDVVGRAMSAATFLPPLPEPSNRFDTTRSLFNRNLARSRGELLSSDYLSLERAGPWTGSELWRVSLRVGALSDVDYGHFVGRLRQAVEPVTEAYRLRHEVMDAIDAEEDGAEEEAGRVIVLGRARPLAVGAEPVRRDENGEEDEEAEIDPDAILASVFAHLMDNAPLRAVLWHDPATGALEGRERSEAWGRLLESAEAVVLIEEHPDYDLEFIRDRAPAFIDASDAARRQSQAAIDVATGVPDPVGAGPVQMVYTGVVPVVYKAQRTLLYSLVESIIWAFVLIACVMSILLNPALPSWKMLLPKNLAYGIGAGLTSMFPNVFPVVLVFGVMGYMGVKVDIGTMMTASVAMGVAVDDTIHFLAWFRDGLTRGLTRRDAVADAYRRVGPAMTQTTLVGGLGLFVFALSTFTPTQRFGVMMLVLLGGALIGDLIFLPAILASPLGRLFRPRGGTNVLTATPPATSPETPQPEDEPASTPTRPAHRADAAHSKRTRARS